MIHEIDDAGIEYIIIEFLLLVGIDEELELTCVFAPATRVFDLIPSKGNQVNNLNNVNFFNIHRYIASIGLSEFNDHLFLLLVNIMV